jgi:hypothetical protein
MLPEFPKARRQMFDLWNTAFFNGLNGNENFLTEIPIRVQKEGDRAFVGGGEMEYKLHSVNFSFSARDGEGMSEEEFFGAALKLGAEMAGRQAKTLFDKMSTPSPHGMPFQWKAGELKCEQFLEILEKMDMDFNGNGKPRLPMMVLPPQAEAEVRTKLAQWHEDLIKRKKWEELIDRKRKDFDEREARRRLVD